MEKDSFGANNNPDPTGVEILSEMPNFERHKHKNNGEKVMRVLELAKLTEARKDEEAFDARLQNLTMGGAYKYLRMLNGMLRGVGAKDRGVRNNVRVGEHMAPARDVQGAILSDTVEALKDIKDNHHRATLAYFTVNNLHLFADGNGRTSRAVYELFDNPNFDLGSDDFTHKTDSANESGNHGNFEAKHQIRSTNKAYEIARYIMIDKMAKEDKLDKRINEMPSKIEIIFAETPDVYLTDDAEQNLTSQEKHAINSAFHDGDIALLTLCRMLKHKGTSDEVIEKSIQEAHGKPYIAIEITKNDFDTGQPNTAAMHTFEGWTADDYRTFLKGFKAVQINSQRTLNDIFKNPERYKRNDGKTWADWLSHR